MKRFLKGFIQFFGALFLIFFVQSEFDITHLSFVVSDYLKQRLGNDLGNIIIIICSSFIGYTLIKSLIVGVYYMTAWEFPIAMYENADQGKEVLVHGNSQYKNINNLMQYREQKMGLMTNEQASAYLIQTSKLDNLYNSNQKNTKRSLDFIEAKIGLMSNDRAIEYISGKLK